MKGRIVLLAAWAAAAPVSADTVVAERTLRANAIIAAGDVRVEAGVTPGVFSDPADVIGLETRVPVYAGRPIPRTSVGPAALVERNQIVTIEFAHAALRITTEGRALGRGGAGDVVRVMNLESRQTVAGRVTANGRIRVGD